MMWLVFVGAGLGGVARWGVGLWLPRTEAGAFPSATLVVNVVGCLVIGLVAGALAAGWREGWSGRDAVRAFVIVGLLGGFTTASSVAWETLQLASVSPARALLYVMLTNTLGLGAAWSGLAAARALMAP